MSDSDDTGRAERAARLRQKISAIVQGPGVTKIDDAKPEEPESPRDFIERRMREPDGKDDA